MVNIPPRPKIYHITHVDNLAQIVRAGELISDAKRIACGLECEIIGLSEIKRRRLEELEVSCHPGTKVGQYVPFYFCPRSIMLFILHRGNHQDITYHGGQIPIVHLQADLYKTISRANNRSVRWAFSDVNAGARYANFYADLNQLDKINWDAVQENDFRNAVVKEGKQAEFLLFESFPWSLVETIGVIDAAMALKASLAIAKAAHRPLVNVQRMWYF